jgi:predicted dehydrogenase
MSIKEALGLRSHKKIRCAIVGMGDIAQEDMMPAVAHTGNSIITALVTIRTVIQPLYRWGLARSCRGWAALPTMFD